MVLGAILEGPGKIRIKDFEKFTPDGSILLKVGAAGVCGTDVHNFSNSSSINPYPFIMGHEVSGTIEAIGEHCKVNSYQKFKVGDRVTVTPMVGCQECYYCKTFPHVVNYCPNRKAIGVGAFRDPPYLFGGFAENMVVPANFWIHKLPDDMPLDVGALAEPLAVAIHGLGRAAGSGSPYFQGNIGINTSVVIQGCGPIGILVAAAAKFSGATVVVLDRLLERLKMAEKIGVTDETIDVSKMTDAELISVVKKMHHGGGPDIVVEATGEPDAVRVGIMLPRRGGKYIELGNAVDGKEIRIRPDYICRNYLEILGSVLAPAHEYPKAIHMLSSSEFPLSKIITHKFKLVETEAALMNASARHGVKSMVIPNKDR